MSHIKSLKVILPLFLGTLVLLGYSYISAQAPAGCTPPNCNASAPVSVSTTGQVKPGSLGLNGLTLYTGAPTLTFYDETVGERGFWLYNNSNRLYMLADRNMDGSWALENPWPMEMFASSTPAGDWVRFSNDVRAAEFCTASGTDCFTAADITSISTPLDTSGFLNTSATTQTKAGQLVISNGGPMLKLDDTNNRSVWLHANSDTFYVLGDRNNTGTDISGWETPHPLTMAIGAATDGSGDSATFANQVRANTFCDRAGGNCTAPATILDTTSTGQTKAGALTVNGNLTGGNLFTTGQVRANNFCDAAGSNCTAPSAILDTTANGQTKAGALTVGSLSSGGNVSGQNVFASNQVRGNTYCDAAGGNCFRKIQSGNAAVPRSDGTPSVGSFNVTFPTAFANVPTVTFTPRWVRYTGDEPSSWWVTNITTTGFTINWKVPGGGTSLGENGVQWIAID